MQTEKAKFSHFDRTREEKTRYFALKRPLGPTLKLKRNIIPVHQRNMLIPGHTFKMIKNTVYLHEMNSLY